MNEFLKINCFIFLFFMTGRLCWSQVVPSVKTQSYVSYQPGYIEGIKSVEDIYQDRSGYIWLTTNYGLIRLDGRTAERFTKLNFTELKSNNFYRNLRIRSTETVFFRDEMRNVYLPDGSGGIHKSAFSDSVYKAVVPSKKLRDSIRNKSLIYISSPTKAFLLEHPGFVELLGERDKYYSTKIASSNGNPSGIFTFYKNHTWINRIGRVDLINGDSVVRMIPKGWSKKNPPDMWLFTSGFSGLFLVADGKLYRCSVDDSGEITAVKLGGIKLDNLISSVFEDPKNGLIYVGSSVGGLQIFQPKKFTSITAGDLSASLSAFFYSPVESRANEIFTTTDRSIFKVKNGKGVKVFSGSQDFNYSALYLDKEDKLWFEDKGGMVIKLDQKTGITTPVYDFNEEIRHIKESEGRLFVLTTESLYQLVKKADQSFVVFKKWNLIIKRASGSINRCNTVLFSDSTQALVGLTDGIISLDLKTGRIQSLADFQNVNIRSLAEIDGLGVMAGSYGDGYFLIENGNRRTLPLDMAGALNSVHAFIPDRKGYLWMPTNDGLIRVLISDLKLALKNDNTAPRFQRFTEADGLMSNEFNGGTNPSFALAGDSIILPGSKGLTLFDPLSFPERIEHPMIVYFEGKRIIEQISLHSDHAVQLEFNRVKSLSSDDERFWYRLVPGGQWKTGQTNEAVYIDPLRAGDYVVEYASFDPALSEDERVNKLKISVDAVWYETTWFFVLILAAAVCVVWLITWARTHFIRKQQQALQKEVDIKTEELNRRNEELNLSVAEIRSQVAFREKVLLVLLHDLKSPMRFVTSSLRMLYSRLATNTETRSISGELVTSVSGIYKFMEDFHNWVMQNNSEQRKSEFISLPSMLAEIKEFYEQVAVVKGDTLVVQSDDIVLRTYPFTLKTIIANLVDNSIKNTEGGIIRISASDSLAFVNISVIDNGSGMGKDKISQLENKMEQTGKSVVPSMGSGVGYSIISEFLKSVNGIICIDSEVGKGTMITISIPKNLFI